MKTNKLSILILGLLLMLMAACNDDENASQQQNTDDYFSSAKTDKSSDEYPQTHQIGNRNNNGENLNPNMFGLGNGNQDLNRQELNRQGGDQLEQGQQGQNQQPQTDEDNQNLNNQNQNQNQNQAQSNQGMNEYTSAVIKLTNQERRNNGLSELKAHKKLSNVARKKSVDMQSNDYFSHTSPTYGSPFDMMRDFGVTYQSAAENIARGQQTAQQVVDGWMNSEGHRENILNGNFTHIGVGYTESGNYWTQMFIQK